MKRIEIHGYAIISADDRIADAAGVMPSALHNGADWAYFQAGLDRADWIAIGRTSHEATPNPKRRRRLVLSRQARALEERTDDWWWNPLEISCADVLQRLLRDGGHIAVPGGQAAFDLFLALGFSTFHLSRVAGVTLPGGRGVFGGCERGTSAESALGAAGLQPDETQLIDAPACVTLTVWRAAASPLQPWSSA